VVATTNEWLGLRNIAGPDLEALYGSFDAGLINNAWTVDKRGGLEHRVPARRRGATIPAGRVVS
jgi:hypothetical protein